MKLKNITILLLILLFSVAYKNAHGQIDSYEHLMQLNKLPISSTHTIAAGPGQTITYNIRAVKIRRKWMLFVSDSADFHVLIYNKKDSSTRTTSDYMAATSIRVFTSGEFKIINKTEKLDDIIVTQYYKFKFKARRRLLFTSLIENPELLFGKGFLSKLFMF